MRPWIVGHHLAQANVATMRWPLESEPMRAFRERLAEVNALADKSPGFIWRLKGESGADAYGLSPYEDPLVLFNLTVWESIDALKAFTYRGDHGAVFRERASWFVPSSAASYAMWWIPAGEIPTMHEGRARLEDLQRHGETDRAFSFRRAFPPP